MPQYVILVSYVECTLSAQLWLAQMYLKYMHESCVVLIGTYYVLLSITCMQIIVKHIF